MKLKTKDLTAMQELRERVEHSWLMLCPGYEEIRAGYRDGVTASIIFDQLTDGGSPMELFTTESAAARGALMHPDTSVEMTYGHKLTYTIDRLESKEEDGTAKLNRHLSVSRRGKNVKPPVLDVIAEIFGFQPSDSFEVNPTTKVVHMMTRWTDITVREDA